MKPSQSHNETFPKEIKVEISREGSLYKASFFGKTVEQYLYDGIMSDIYDEISATFPDRSVDIISATFIVGDPE